MFVKGKSGRKGKGCEGLSYLPRSSPLPRHPPPHPQTACQARPHPCPCITGHMTNIMWQHVQVTLAKIVDVKLS